MMKRIKESVGFLIGLTIISQLIAFFRESMFAYYYGTSFQADAYVMASQIPIALFAVVTTSINTVILPIYTEKMEKNGRIAADQFLYSFIVVFEFICLGLTILSCIFSNQIVFIFAPFFSGELQLLTVRYVRLLFPTIMLSSLINILTVSYNVEKKFAFPQCVGLLQNISIIIIMFFFAHSMNTDAAVLGTILGIALNAAILIFPCFRIFRSKLEISSLWMDLIKVLSKVIPVACGIGIAEINRIIDKAIASGLDTGSITALNYANKLAVVFSALIVGALSTVSFQNFSVLYAKGKYDERLKELKRYLQVLIYILIPITCGALLLKRELIIVAFARGAFGSEAVDLTSNIFFYYSLGIVPIAVREILSKYYYSSGDTVRPVINSAIGVVINIILNIILAKFMGASGLALATTISYYLVCCLLFFNIFKKENKKMLIDFLKSCVPCSVSSGMMTCFLIFLLSKVSITTALAKLLLCLTTGSLLYTILIFIFAREQLKEVIHTLFGRM